MSIVRWLSAALLTLAATAAAHAQSTPLSSLGLTTLFAQEGRPGSTVSPSWQVQLPILVDDVAVTEPYEFEFFYEEECPTTGGIHCWTDSGPDSYSQKKLTPHSVTALHMLKSWQAACNAGNFKKAEKIARKFVELEPNNPAAQRVLAMTVKLVQAANNAQYKDILVSSEENQVPGCLLFGVGFNSDAGIIGRCGRNEGADDRQAINCNTLICKVLNALANAAARTLEPQAERATRRTTSSRPYDVPNVQFRGPISQPRATQALDPDCETEYKDILVQVQETQTSNLLLGQVPASNQDSIVFSADCGYLNKFLEYCKKQGPLGLNPVCSALADACSMPAGCCSTKACCKDSAGCCAKGSAGKAKAACCAKDCKCGDKCNCAKSGTCCAATATAKCGCGKDCACCKCGEKVKKTRSARALPVRMAPRMPEFVWPCPWEAGHCPALPFNVRVMPPPTYSVIAVSPPPHVAPVPHMPHMQQMPHMVRPMVSPMPPMVMPHPQAEFNPAWMPPLPTPVQVIHDLTTVRNLAQARARACAESAVAHPGQRAHLATPNLEAHCERLSSASDSDHVLLEGDVHLTSKRNGAVVVVTAQRLLVNVKDGTFTTLEAAQSVSAPPQAVRMPGCPVEPTGHVVPQSPWPGAPPAPESHYIIRSYPKEAFQNRSRMQRQGKPMMPVCPDEDGVNCPDRCPHELPEKIDD